MISSRRSDGSYGRVRIGLGEGSSAVDGFLPEWGNKVSWRVVDK